MKEEHASLLDKYYKGDTSIEEELLLKKEMAEKSGQIPEKDIFKYYLTLSGVPEGLEEDLFNGMKKKIRKRNLRISILSLSTAAVLFLMVALYGVFEREQKTERNFKTMEQALALVSKSLQAEEEEPEMFVLWVDDNVEVIFH